MATLKSIKNKYLQTSDGDTLGVDDNASNVALLAFKMQAADSIAKFNMVDGFADAYADATGIDASASTNEVRNAANYYIGTQTTTLTRNGASGSQTLDVSASDSISASIWGAGGETGTTGCGSSQGAGAGGQGGYMKVTVDTSSISSLIIVAGLRDGGGTGYSNCAGNGGKYSGIFKTSETRGNALAIAGAGGGGASAVVTWGAGGSVSSNGGAGNGGGNEPGSGGANASLTAGNAVGTGTSNAGGGGGSGYTSGSGGGGSNPHDYGGGGGSGSNYGGASETTIVENSNNGDSVSTSDPNYDSSYGGVNEHGRVSVSYDGAGDLTLISNSATASAQPDTADIVATYTNGAGTATLNTDLKYHVSRDNGTTYTEATMVSQGTSGGHLLVSARNIDISGQPAGTTMRYKVTSHNQSANKETRAQAVSLAWA